MKPYIRVTGIVAPLDRPNVDTDQIIPAKYLKRVERTGFGPFLEYLLKGVSPCRQKSKNGFTTSTASS